MDSGSAQWPTAIVPGSALRRRRVLQETLPDIPNDPIIVNAIKTAFLQLDFTILDYAGQLIQHGGPLAHVVSGAAHAFSGSCALLALYDPTHSVLRLANVGDSRAVLGRWNGTKYVCEPMSVDHTGFNPDEVSRLQREHPGEHGIVDPRS